jgi:phage N-6-adenine-methyltransferase
MPHAPGKQSHSQRWATPHEFFNGINSRYHFTLDVCAEPWSAKCVDYYTKEDDGLTQPWWSNEEQTVFFCNPPYSNIGVWLERGIDAILEHDVSGCYLVPASTGPQWFHRFVFGKCHIGFVKGRLEFEKPADVDSDEPGANFDSMLLSYDMGTLRGGPCLVYTLGTDGQLIEPASNLHVIQRSLW